MLTSDPIYTKPYKPRITIKNTANNTTYYTSDPWINSGNTNQALFCGVNLSENSNGDFTVQIEDGGQTLNRNNINVGARLIVEIGKYQAGMYKVISGLIRETGDSRGENNKDLYNLFGSSTGIRFNERISYFVREAAKLAQDGITLDVNDPFMKADALLQALVNIANESLIYTASTLAANSDVEIFVPSMAVEYGELADGIAQIEEYTNSDFGLTVDDIAFLRYELRLNNGGRGYTIKNEPPRYSLANDDADDTMYLKGKNWNHKQSVYKSASYSNRNFGILPGETPPSNPTELGSGYNASSTNFYTTGNNCIARKFRPTHGHFFSNDFYLVLSQVFGSTSGGRKPYNPIFCIVDDAGTGTPANKVPLVEVSFWPSSFSSSGINADGGTVVNEAAFADPLTGNILASQDIILDTSKDYWFIMTAINSQSTPGNTAEKNTLWWTDTSKNCTIATGSKTVMPIGSPPSNTGSPWTVTTGNAPLFAMPRIRAVPYDAWDPKAINAIGSGLPTGGTSIETTLANIPSIIKTKEGMYKYMVQQLNYMAFPRDNFSMGMVTAPNIPPVPGDMIVITDTKLRYSTVGNPVVMSKIGDMNYSFGSFDGQGMTYEAPTKLSMNPVTTVQRYK